MLRSLVGSEMCIRDRNNTNDVITVKSLSTFIQQLNNNNSYNIYFCDPLIKLNNINEKNRYEKFDLSPPLRDSVLKRPLTITQKIMQKRNLCYKVMIFILKVPFLKGYFFCRTWSIKIIRNLRNTIELGQCDL